MRLTVEDPQAKVYVGTEPPDSDVDWSIILDSECIVPFFETQLFFHPLIGLIQGWIKCTGNRLMISCGLIGSGFTKVRCILGSCLPPSWPRLIDLSLPALFILRFHRPLGRLCPFRSVRT